MKSFTTESLKELLTCYKSTADISFIRQDDKISSLLDDCLDLIQRDYNTFTIINKDICATYPHRLFIISSDKKKEISESKEMESKLFSDCKLSRVRNRFVVPVLFYNQKHICRSGTLSHETEVIFNTIHGRTKYFLFGDDTNASTASPPTDATSEIFTSPSSIMEKLRKNDICLLKALNVTCIADLMVEHQKVKFGLTVSSSEKVDIYGKYVENGFQLLGIPYPGVEFFQQFKSNNYNGKELKFDWTQAFANANISVPDISRFSNIDWKEYKSWDLIELTRNYLLLFLHHISDKDGGLLIHCISGWDRTPLFISLLRMSLWADGVVHQSLSALEVVYLTISYDCHLLADRTSRGEDIFFFCFYFLQFIEDEEYSINAAKDRKAKLQEIFKVFSESMQNSQTIPSNSSWYSKFLPF